MEKRKLLIISDDPNLTSGLGRIVRELSSKLLEKFDMRVAGWHHLPLPHPFPFYIYPLDKNNVIKSESDFKLTLQDFLPEIILFIGDVWDLLPIRKPLIEYKERRISAKVIGWITVDGEGLHTTWTEIFQFLDRVIAFSYFGREEIFKLSKVKADVIYPGIDHKVFYKREIELQTAEKTVSFNPKKTFLVLNVNQNTDRKNIPLLLEAFEEFARDKEDAFLFLATDPNDPQGYDLWDMIQQLKIGKKVAITKDVSPVGGVPDVKLNFIYNLATVFVSTSIGEGYGLFFNEAMACGVPIIATNYSTAPELLAEGRGRLIKVAGFLRGAYGIRRALASKADLINHLSILYRDWRGERRLLKSYDEKGKTFIKELSWDRTAEQLISAIEIEKKSQPWIKKHVIVRDIRFLMVAPSWGKNCGIAEYSRSLSENLRLQDFSVMVFPSKDLTALIDFVAQQNLNVLHFQHEFSFWPEKDKLRKVLRELNSRGVKTILTLHSFCRGLTSYNLMLAECVDKIIVHAKAFKEELQALESIDSAFKPQLENIQFIPMGCNLPILLEDEKIRETRNYLDIANRSPIIGSFGFLREQKGYKDLIFAVKTLREKFERILCLIYAPPHEFGSKVYDEQFFKLIEREGLEDLVLIIRDYCKEEKMLQVLQSVDLFVLNYRDDPAGGGISAAVKTLMRTQRPIIVADSIAFRDLNKEVIKIEKSTVQKLADTIDHVWMNEDLKRLLVNRANAFLENNSWERVALEHLKIYGE